MTGALLECQLRATRPRIATAVMSSTQAQFEADIKLMTETALDSTLLTPLLIGGTNPALQVIRKRKESPTDPDAPKDLLDRMLTVVDTKTGKKMADESIVDNVHSFLVLLRCFLISISVDHLPHRWP